MQTLEFSIRIESTAEKLWDCLWHRDNYRRWTAVFCAGSDYATDHFATGSKIHLFAPNGDGLYSILDQVVPGRLLVFRHLGELKAFKEQPADASLWTEALERYEISTQPQGVMLRVQVDTLEPYVEMMQKTFPIALQEVKQMAETV